MPRMLHSSQVKRDANRGSLLLIILEGSLYKGKVCLAYNAAVSSALMSSVQGMNCAILVQSWSVIVKIESYPWDTGSFVIKLRAMVSNGRASGFGYMGLSGAFVGRVLTLCR